MALNRQKMRTVNSTPMAIEIQRTRASVGGVGPSRSQMVIKTRPITLRNDSIVSTSQAAPATILTSTSETPSTIAAAIPGATGKIEREVKGEDAWEGITPDAYAAAARTATSREIFRRSAIGLRTTLSVVFVSCLAYRRTTTLSGTGPSGDRRPISGVSSRAARPNGAM